MAPPVMGAIAVRKKVISIGHLSPCFRLQSLQFLLFVRSNQDGWMDVWIECTENQRKIGMSQMSSIS